MGGVRQQFSTAAEVRLARESIAFFEELGSEWFQQVGYLFLATTEAGLVELEERRKLRSSSVFRSNASTRASSAALLSRMCSVLSSAEPTASPIRLL